MINAPRHTQITMANNLLIFLLIYEKIATLLRLVIERALLATIT
jgi:hypothetical protein